MLLSALCTPVTGQDASKSLSAPPEAHGVLAAGCNNLGVTPQLDQSIEKRCGRSIAQRPLAIARGGSSSEMAATKLRNLARATSECKQLAQYEG